MSSAEVAVLTLPDGTPVTAAVQDGRLVVPVFTSSPHLDVLGGLAFELVAVPDLLNRLPHGHALYVNPPGPAGAVLETGPVAEAIERRTRTDRTLNH